MATWQVRISIAGLVLLALSGCALLQPPDAGPAPDPVGPGGELNAVPVRDALPPELQSLREQGLAVRGDRVIFEGELDFPPKLKGVPITSGARPAVTPGTRPSMQESRLSMRAAAVANPRVRAALGERFSLLGSGWIEADKDAPADAERYQLSFYNYARNEVVTVVTSRAREVLEVQSAPARVQPAESREEVDAAIEIVRRDERYGRLVKDLRGRGIQTPSPGADKDRDRYLYLLFYREPRTPAGVEATVNMSAGKVVAARPLR
jgi:hypothetical protein